MVVNKSSVSRETNEIIGTNLRRFRKNEVEQVERRRVLPVDALSVHDVRGSPYTSFPILR